MISISIKKIIIIIFFLSFAFNYSYSNTNLKIIYKINDKIITNIDLENEKKFLFFLNPNLSNLTNSQVDKISSDSLKNRIIKEIELKNYYDLTKKDIALVYIDNFILNNNYNNKDDLIKQLSQFGLKYKYFEKRIVIDNLWREFIFNKFKSKINVDIKILKKKIKNQKSEIEELNLSEILFEVGANEDFDNLVKKIYLEIDKSGFEAAASIFSLSDSKNFGGKLGWIESSQISGEIYSKIQSAESLSEPIKTNNGYLILKINERRKIKKEINPEKELKKLINIETEKELNKLGYIYFNKIKKRTFVSEIK